MSCSRTRLAISLLLDAEDGVDEQAVADHLEECAACRAYAAEAGRLHRAIRLTPAPPVPDLTARILGAIGEEPSARDRETQRALRWSLVVVALVQIAVAIPALVFGTDAGLPVHTARHIGSFDAALAVGFLFAAWRPSRISGLLSVVAALVVCLLGSSFLDVLDGNTQALSEAHHVTAVAGLVVVWLLQRPPLRRVQLA